MEAQDRVNLASAIRRLKNFDNLDVAMGDKENSSRLIARLEDELEHQQEMQTSYKATRVIAGGTAGWLRYKALMGIVSDLVGK